MIEENKINISKAISYGWETTINNLNSLLLIFLVYACFSLFPSFVTFAIKDEVARAMVCTLSVVINCGLVPGLVLSLFRLSNNEQVNIKTLFSGFNYLKNYLLASLAYTVIIFAGFMLLVVPGIIWSIQFSFFVFFIVDRKASPIESLRLSSQITTGKKIDLFLLYLTLFLINILGVICFLIGYIFITLPLSMLATIYVYKELSVAYEANYA